MSIHTGDERGCDTCGRINPERCGHACIPPTSYMDKGYSAWIPKGHVPSSVPPEPTQLQSIGNLIMGVVSRAFDTPDCRFIGFSCSHDGDRTMVEVDMLDDGVPCHYVEHIAVPWEDVHSTIVRRMEEVNGS